MLKKMPMAAVIAGALSLAALPFTMGVASAQEPPTAPTPSDSGSMSKDSMSKDSMSKDSMSKSSKKSMKKHHHMKKKM